METSNLSMKPFVSVPGQREAMMSLRVRDDMRVEIPENFTLLLMQADPSDNTLFLPLEQATLKIQDNDSKRDLH